MEKIPFNKPFITGNEIKYIKQTIENMELAGDGSFTKLCNKWLEEKHGCEKALLTHSCTAALEMATILIDIKPGDEVIMPSFTFVSTANAVVLRGGVPVFIDINKYTLNMDENLIEEAITEKTKAVIPVHYAGIPCEMDTIERIARKNGLKIIEDAAQAFLSTYKNKPIGSIGDFGCLSFHVTKNVISGEGGALLINNESFCERAEIIREKGTNRSRFFRGEIDKYTWVDIGSSYLPGEIIAAFLYAQLEQAESMIAKRCVLFDTYMELLLPLEELGIIKLPRLIMDITHNAHIFYFLTSGLEERTHLLEYLKSNGIFGAFHYIPLHSSPAGLRFGKVSGEITNTDQISKQIIRLPLYPEMGKDDIDNIVSRIRKFYNI